MYVLGKKGNFKEEFEEWSVKVKILRWIYEKADNTITSMTARDYCSIISQSKKSHVIMCGATEKKVPQTMILQPSPEKPSLTDNMCISTNKKIPQILTMFCI